MPLNILLFYFRQAEWAACIYPQNIAIVPIKYQEQVREEMVNPLHSNKQDTSAPHFYFISQFIQCFNFWSTAVAFFQVQIQLVFSLYDYNAEYKKKYCVWCHLFNECK